MVGQIREGRILATETSYRLSLFQTVFKDQLYLTEMIAELLLR